LRVLFGDVVLSDADRVDSIVAYSEHLEVTQKSQQRTKDDHRSSVDDQNFLRLCWESPAVGYGAIVVARLVQRLIDESDTDCSIPACWIETC
jgi:hypothetical protein